LSATGEAVDVITKEVRVGNIAGSMGSVGALAAVGFFASKMRRSRFKKAPELDIMNVEISGNHV